jgi:phosphomevalonate kinase
VTTCIARVRAPGKLVLVGEYGVLDGAGAVVAAVDRGVRCDVHRPTATSPAGIVTPGDDRYVRAALARAPGALDAARYVFRDDNPTDLSDKPGFGGSAAATVAACVAAGLPPATATEVHAAVQGGGSGVDVFAATHGGVRRFPTGAPVPCPALVAVYSGTSAQTGPRVHAYRAWAERDPQGHAAFVRASGALVDAFAGAPLATLHEAYALLRAMAQASGLAYDTPAHARIAALARSHGGAAKPSGAGGGDVAVALFEDPDALEAFAEACAREGYPPIRVRVAVGAHRETIDIPTATEP